MSNTDIRFCYREGKVWGRLPAGLRRGRIGLRRRSILVGTRLYDAILGSLPPSYPLDTASTLDVAHQMSSHDLRLPAELLSCVFDHLDQPHLIRSASVSRRWRALAIANQGYYACVRLKAPKCAPWSIDWDWQVSAFCNALRNSCGCMPYLREAFMVNTSTVCQCHSLIVTQQAIIDTFS